MKRVIAKGIAAATTACVVALGIAAIRPSGELAAQVRQPAPLPARAVPVVPVLAPLDSLWYRDVVRTLSQPRWDGRGIGTAGIDSAASYIATQMTLAGLDVPFSSGFFQSFEVTTGVAVGEPCGVVAGPATVKAGDDMQPLGFSTNGTLRAPAVFAGYGITAPGYEWDDYAGLDVRDKIVVVLAQEPGEMDSTGRFDGNLNTPYAELRTKAITAREHGALGLIVVNGPQHHKDEPLRKPRTEGAGYMSSGLLAAVVSEYVADEMLVGAGMKLVDAQRVIEENKRPHSFELKDSVTLTVTLKRTRARTRNVAGMIRGRDPSRTFVIGAHYDHLGFGTESSLDPDAKKPHVGADDNASGVAAMLGVARRMRARIDTGWRPKHSLVFCAFTGEESGLLGSSHFTDDPPVPLEQIEFMLNFDMVGRLRDNKLMIMGTGTSDSFAALVARANAKAGRDSFALRTSSDGYGPSDHSSFYKRQIPVLFMFTGAHADYHKPSDTWNKIHAHGIERIADFAAGVVNALDEQPKPPYRKAEADSSVGRIAGGGGYGAYLGTIPDYMQTEGGVLLSGVRSGGPAATAGLLGGDVIVQFDGVRVDNIYDYTYALRSRKPGQEVRVTVKRKGEEKTFVVTLARRPG